MSDPIDLSTTSTETTYIAFAKLKKKNILLKIRQTWQNSLLPTESRINAQIVQLYLC